MKKLVVALVVLVLVTGVVVIFQRLSKPRPPVVRTTTVSRGKVAAYIRTTGIMRSVEDSTVRAKVEGRIERILVDEGDIVTNGQELLVFDRTEAENRLARAADSVALAMLELADSERELKQSRELSTAHAEAQSRLEANRIRYERALVSKRLAEKELELAQDRLQKLACRSPQNGRVVHKYVEEGEYVQPGHPLFDIAETARLEALCEVDEIDIPLVKVGNNAIVETDSLPEMQFEGVVTKIAPQAKVVRGAIVVEVSVALRQETELLRIGNQVDVRIIIQESGSEVYTLPVEAVHGDGSERFVFVMVGNTVARRRVRVGIGNPSVIEILEGLDPAERVVVCSTSELKDGEVVEER